MAVKLRELYKSTKHFDIKLIAGQKGLDNIVRWVHMVENISLSVFFKSHEIAFTSGIGIKTEAELLELVKYTHSNDASGMVINIGPHIESIPTDVINFANNNDFPLFEIPWDVYIADIMREFSYKITIADITNMELSNAVKNAIFFHTQEALYVPHLERHAFKAHWAYSLTVVEVINQKTKKVVSGQKRERFFKVIENQVAKIKKRAFSLELDDRIVIVLAKYSSEQVDKIINNIKLSCDPLLGKDEEIFFSIGYNAKNIKCIGKSYQKALNVLKLQKRKKKHKTITSYNDLGLYKLLLSLDDTEIIKEYHGETLEPLIKYDSLNNTDFIVVLRSYLETSGSVKEVAEMLFYHRNTINYKIKKIEEILDCNLSELSTRLKLTVAFMLLDIQ